MVLFAVVGLMTFVAGTSFATPVAGQEIVEADDGCDEDCPCDDEGEEDCEENCEDCSCSPSAASPAALANVPNITEQQVPSEIMPSITGAQRDGPPLSLFKPPRHLSI